jgi:hypothetical protein
MRWLQWDPRWVEVGRFSLNPANGLFRLELKSADLTRTERKAELTAFVDWDSGLVSVCSDVPVDLLSVLYTSMDFMLVRSTLAAKVQHLRT